MTYRNETEARAVWCPLARSADDGVTVNRTPHGSGQPDGDCKCIASQCMAWRWRYGTMDGAGQQAQQQGFCGAFGRPVDAGNSDTRTFDDGFEI